MIARQLIILTAVMLSSIGTLLAEEKVVAPTSKIQAVVEVSNDASPAVVVKVLDQLQVIQAQTIVLQAQAGGAAQT